MQGVQVKQKNIYAHACQTTHIFSIPAGGMASAQRTKRGDHLPTRWSNVGNLWGGSILKDWNTLSASLQKPSRILLVSTRPLQVVKGR